MTDSAFQTSNVLAAVRKLAPEIAARANEIEKLRAIPPDLNDKLQDAGVYRMLIPRYYRGEELHPIQVSRVLQELGRADASASWHGMVAVGFNIMLGHFSRELTDKLFASSPDVLVRGALAPKGTAVPDKGGYTAQGGWALGSGSYDYKWVMANCVVLKDGKPEIGANGAPAMRAVLVPKDKADFLDTWDAVGLRGTASHDFVLKEQHVDELYTADLMGPATFDIPMQKLPFYMIAQPTHGSVALGIVEGALEDLIALSKSKRPAFGGGKRLSEDTVFNYRLGELVVRFDALRAVLEQCIMDTWTLANSRDPVTPVNSSRTAAIAAYVQVQCVDIVNEIFTLAGSSACYNSSSISRRWRDIRCVAQHTAASTASYQTLGSALVSDTSGVTRVWGMPDK